MKLAMALVSLLFAFPAFAAKFSPISGMTSPRAQQLVKVAQALSKYDFFSEGIVKAGTQTFAFTRKDTEKDFSMTKQMSYRFGNANSDDTQMDFNNTNVSKIVEYSLYAVENVEGDAPEAFKAARTLLNDALLAIQADTNLKVYGSGHADEDGSWQNIYVIDSKNNEVLKFTIGYAGT